MAEVACVHRPCGGTPAELLWDKEALDKESLEKRERIGICVCILCGDVFAGIFTDREMPTNEEGSFRYVGPFTGRKKAREQG